MLEIDSSALLAVPRERAQTTIARRRRWQREPKARQALTDAELVTENERLKLSQRRVLAIVAGSAALGQVICADIVFIIYANRGMHWRIPTTAIESWLAATVVQVIGIVLVITRSLFPAPSKDPAD